MANEVMLTLNDSQGRSLRTLLKEHRNEGEHEVRINVADLPTGIYFYQLKTGFYQETKKLIIAR